MNAVIPRNLHDEACDAPSMQSATAASGHPVLRITGEGGRATTLHSLIDPVKEALRWYDGKKIPHGSILIVIGAGSGYHIDALIQEIEGGVVVVIEHDPRILRHMASVCPMTTWLTKVRLYLLCAANPDDIVHAVSRIQMRYGMRRLTIVEHAPALRADPSFYQPVCERLHTAATTDIGSRLRYKKFQTAPLRVLLLHSRYYLLPEIMRALSKLGHQPHAIMLDTGTERTGTQGMIERILAEIIRLRPDFVLTVNHLGFDREGILTRLLSDIELPYASWFVDNPLFILEDFKKQRSPYAAFFVWDRDYCNDLTDRGFDNVTYLPLAADTGIFKKNAGLANDYIAGVGFVGNSGEQTVAACLEEIGDPAAWSLVERLAVLFEASPCRSLEGLVASLHDRERELLERHRERIERAVTWRATQRYRIACVRRLSQFSPHVYGDEGWRRYLNGSTVIKHELNYYEDLPRFYPRCMINFNSTSLQMKNGMNQRVFDVPACGAFLITDYREQLEDAFAIGREVVCYRDIDEIEQLVAYYLRHHQERLRIAEAAWDRVNRDHTYVHRLDTMVRCMRRMYA